MTDLKKSVLAILPLMFSPVTQASTVVGIWTPPTTRADGTPLPITDLSAFNFYCSAQAGGPYSLLATAPPNATSITTSPCVPDGSMGYFVVTAVDTSGRVSAYSNEATKFFSTSGPNPPAIPACVEPPRKYYVYGYASQTYVSLYDDAVKKVIGWAKAFDFQGFPRVCEGDSTTVFTAQAWLYTTDDETGERGKALCQRWDR